jgi:hypothetical protein
MVEMMAMVAMCSRISSARTPLRSGSMATSSAKQCAVSLLTCSTQCTGYCCPALVTVSVEPGELLQANPPAPTDPALFVEETEAFDAFVVGYGGWQSMDKFTQHAGAVFDTLHTKSIAVRRDEYYAVGYDSPFRFVNRHNEVCIYPSL